MTVYQLCFSMLLADLAHPGVLLPLVLKNINIIVTLISIPHVIPSKAFIFVCSSRTLGIRLLASPESPDGISAVMSEAFTLSRRLVC